MPTRRIAGIKASIPAGYVLGRTQGGEGDVGLIAIRDLGGSLIASGAVAAPGASGTTNFIGRQIKTATGTYTKSAGTTLVRIILLGGGAAGGGAPATGATQQSEGAGGGAGGLTDVVASVTAYDGHTVTIGAGGTGGTGLGGSGGNSTFVGLTANGGTGGGAGVLTNIGVAGGVGGTASGGDINLTGRKGWFSSIALNGGDTLSGAGAEAPYGLGTPGAMVQTATTAAGLSATGFGAGGSGAANGASQSAATGGNGSPGLCIIDEYGPASGGGGGGGGGGSGTVTSLSQGTGITLTPNPITSTGTIDNAGVTSNVAGTGISVSGPTGAVTIGNTGVTSAIAGTGISVSGASGAVTIGNTGVTGLTGSNNIKVSSSTGAVTLSSNSINPTGTDADLVPWAAIEGLRWKYTCSCATAAALPTVTYSNGSSGSGATLTASATGVVTVDGHTLAISDSVLVKNQVSGFQNGIYQVTTAGAVGVALVLTRAPWNDDVVGTTGYTAAIASGEMLAVLFGTSNGNSIWQNTSTGSGAGGAIVVGTDSIAYTKIASSGSSNFSGNNALMGQLMTAPPTKASTGFGTTFINQGSLTCTDVSSGVLLQKTTSEGATHNHRFTYFAVPSTPYTYTGLVSADVFDISAGFFFGWYDGTSKIDIVLFWSDAIYHGTVASPWTSPTYATLRTRGVNLNLGDWRVWVRFFDDGTNIGFSYSNSGETFPAPFTVNKSTTGFLGASGYNNIIFGLNPNNTPVAAVLSSWKKT